MVTVMSRQVDRLQRFQIGDVQEETSVQNGTYVSDMHERWCFHSLKQEIGEELQWGGGGKRGGK